MEFDPEALDLSARYKLLIGGVTPRPIAVVSTISAAGVVNVAPFSFFNAAGMNPMTLMFVTSNRSDGRPKDSLRNARPESEGGTGEFVVNLAVEAYARRVAAAAEELGPDESELEVTRFDIRASRRVKPPRLAASPMAFECVTSQIVEVGDQPMSGTVVFGRVVHIHAADGVVNERFHVDADAVASIGRMGGRFYCRTRERFSLPNGVGALDLAPPFPEDTGAK